ncbi:MAG: hypothetical protein ABWZ17_04580 [Candidatus Binatia bacterium]
MIFKKTPNVIEELKKTSLRKADGSILWLQISMSEILVQWEFCVRG